MDSLSNNCIAWFCRSTHPFQTFLVYINGWYGWFWPTPFASLPMIALCYIYPFQELGLNIEYRNFAMFTHTYHSFGLSVVLCDNLCPSILGVLLLISPHKLIFFHGLFLYLTTPTSNIFLSGTWLPCRGGSENPHSNLRILTVWMPVSYFPHLPSSRKWDDRPVSCCPDAGSFWEC